MIRIARFLCIGALGCGGTSELVVVVDSNLTVPSELALIRVVVEDRNGKPQSLNDFVLDEPGAPSLPFSFGVVPLDGDSSRTIEIELSAFDETRTLSFVARARTGFIANKTLRLPMFLPRLCLMLDCSDDETCTDEGCTSATIAVEMLSEVEPGKEI